MTINGSYYLNYLVFKLNIDYYFLIFVLQRKCANHVSFFNNDISYSGTIGYTFVSL